MCSKRFAPGTKNIFAGPHGIRAGWRLLIFAGILAAGFILAGFIQRLVLTPAPATKASLLLTPAGVLEGDGVILVVVLIATTFMSKIERRPFATYGLPFSARWIGLFGRGALWGFLAITAVLFAMFLLGGYRITGLATHGEQLATAVALWVPTFLIVGVSEEFAFRGYAQYTLTTGIGFWPAALLLSGGFTAAHLLLDPGEAPMGLTSEFVFGLMMCFVLLRTGNLWWGIGYHAAWDWGETFFYGVPDGGFTAWHSLLSSSFSGPAWLTGGGVGPEGSVLELLSMFVVAAFIARAYPRDSYCVNNAA